ncbi:uncharacterized protein MONOS_18282 [Monocercomonoides exilis]|uniref:uncharacterized protein n=1 Tax=Monocercomonoides exilis TaxID=2049356 RepID=UPI0035597C22|nr:hypothetical protein MONOS_18282 [Monocercomonoides exilis]
MGITLDVQSLKGGDGAMPNTSLWILSEGCKLEGIAGERASSLFIPTLDFIRKEMNGNMIELILLGTILLPCDLKLCIISSIESTEAIETYELEKNAFISEREVHCFIEGAKIDSVLAEVEVTAQILSELQEKRDGVAVKGENKAGTSWVIIVIAMGFILLIVLIGLIVFVVRWRRAKERTKELEEIVNDTVKKDPKAFEMVTMEMSPEEQWRRAEREAEKKNEERIKKRVYEKSLGHSESSEHLLSESGSTEYILGRDSDKIPEWMLEKVDEKEEEEIRKRTPSPSISSTSTTDSDSTFVRGEDLCPTTSSMSNLVDAMACSSPHEKLIVDLRDSLFMLLHGRNEKKEMAIGSLQERVFTAAQVLFWVANGALYSFDEDKELPSLAGLSSLIVLFSEHMVICIAMHSDCSDDSSDSSSVSSSSTIISSSSDCSSVNKKGRDSPPSSAFEDDEDNRKECMRWKAPELLINKKMRATKESVAFSIGMMLWECLTLEIPFGEYEAVTAGQKIVNGERPDIDLTEERGMWNVVRKCCSPDPLQRPTLSNLKREFIQHFPAGTVMLAVSDAIDLEQSSKEEGESTGKDTEALLS